MKSNYFIPILFLIIFYSCGEYEVLEHNKKISKRIDSLYKVNKDSLSKVADSICVLKFPTYKKEAKDSIQSIRILEIEKLLEQ